jgi:hypothetical protein
MTVKKKIIITLLIILVPVAILILFMLQPEDDLYSISTEKDSSFDKKVERIFVIAKVEERLKPVFAHSFEHSMISAFQSNGVEAIVTVTSPESDNLSDYDKEAEAFAPDATMRININPLYRTRDDGYQAIVGTDFEVSLIDTATEKRGWHATGKVDFIRMFGPDYIEDAFLEDFAWLTSAAIVEAFIAEVNDRKPAPIPTLIED